MDTEVGNNKPVSKQWERFQLLKERRDKLSKRTSKRLIKTMKQSTLAAVRRQISLEDVKDVFESEGVVTINHPVTTSQPSTAATTTTTATTDDKWDEVKTFLHPNPQLIGSTVSMNSLEKRVNDAVKLGKLEEAVELSDKLSKVEFASRVVTAFDCHEYQKQKQRKEKNKRRKAKLKWRYEHKQKWEMKSNM